VAHDNDGGYSPASPGQSGPQAAYPPYPPQYGPGQFAPPPGHVPVPPYPAPPPRPRRRRWPWVAGAMLAVAVVLLALGGYAVTRGGPNSEPQTISVTYEVTGSPGSVQIRYHDSEGHLSRPQTVSPPWQAQVLVREGSKQLVSVSGERADSSDEPLTCRITADGKSIDRKQSAGGFVFCGGYVGAD